MEARRSQMVQECAPLLPRLRARELSQPTRLSHTFARASQTPAHTASKPGTISRLGHPQNLVGANITQHLHLAARPAQFEFANTCVGSQPEMHAPVRRTCISGGGR